MAYRENEQSISLLAAADLSGDQFSFVTIDATGKAAKVSVAGAAAQGVLENTPKADEAANVNIGGVVQATAGAGVTAGDDVASDANGKAVTATTGDVILGKATTTASGAGTVFSMLFNPRGDAA